LLNMKGTSLDLRDRRASFAALEAERFDLLIIGAGITGCGVARDAAMRGLRVALIDANDIGSGTSSRSSKLIHGGLRYLLQKDVLVVREAANERRILRGIAPHLALTMPMVIPARSKIAIAQVRALMWSYEKLGRVDKEEEHEVWDADRLRVEEPHVAAEGLSGAVVYPEYLTDDLRLTLANARSAACYGAVVVTYAAADRMIIENGRAAGSVVRSTLPCSEEGAEVRARIVVNAAGPWVDAIRRLEDRGAKKRLQLTKGIHVVLSRDRLPIKWTIIMSTPDARRIFAVPRGQFVYLGTTDTFYPKPEYWPEITREDLDYLIDNAGHALDVGPFKGKDIVALWSGLRPLLGAEGKKPSEISRRHEIMEGPRGLLTIAGGKLTSYRSMAERLVNQCEKLLSRKPHPGPTAKEPLPGGDFTGTVHDLQSRVEGLGLAPYEAERATLLYGSEALSIFAKERGPAVEAAHAVKKEGALTLEDYWMRRSARACFDEDGGLAALEPAVERMGELLNWSVEEREGQVEACRARRTTEMRVLQGL
jgi:glycerol-3-phosphate dehydrogenase